MILIEKEIINGKQFFYYHGIDFEMIRNHPKDGSSGFFVFIIESFLKEIRNYERETKLDSVLSDSNYDPFDTKFLSHDFVAIYQYEGVGFENMLSAAKKQIREYKSDDWPDNNNEYH